MGHPNNESQNPQLDALFAEYKAALPDPEATSGFMPQLWRRIATRRAHAASSRTVSATQLSPAGYGSCGNSPMGNFAFSPLALHFDCAGSRGG